MKSVIQSIAILVVLISLIYYSKHKIKSYFEGGRVETSISEEQVQEITRLNMLDPRYRPKDLVLRVSKFEPTVEVKFIENSDIEMGNVVVDSLLLDGVGNHVLKINDQVVFGNGEMIDIGPTIRYSTIELTFFTTQSTGTCCGGFKSLYLVRFIKGFGFGIEEVGTIHNGTDDFKALLNRFSIVDNDVVVYLDKSELKKQFVRIGFLGSKINFTEEIPHEVVSRDICNFLWEMLNDYLKEVKTRSSEEDDLLDFVSAGQYNAARQMYSYVVNTQTGFNPENYARIGEKIRKEKFIHKDLKRTLERQVCGWK
ncbi:hypothetical protein [Bdellovibrio bacteriovorus]|uniref:hypothetical protein n=1 Tax=Bdellovibrio bacteriovorus TaxID=959 RepID=UPI0035A688A6